MTTKYYDVYKFYDLTADAGMDLIESNDLLKLPIEEQNRAKRVSIPEGVTHWVEVPEVKIEQK